MRLRNAGFLLVVGGIVVTLCGCPGFPRRNGGGSLSPEVEAAVEAVLAKGQATFQALAGFAEGFNPRLDDEQTDNFGECPAVTAERQNGTFTVDMDFGDGCTNRFYPDSTVSGRILMTLMIGDTRSGSVTYEDFAVDDRTITGTFDLTITREGFDRLISGTVDLAISDTGTAEGTLEMEFRFSTGRFTLQEGTLTLADETATYVVDIDGIVIRPDDNDNFVPEDGTVSFSIPNDDPPPQTLSVVITFDSRSPVDGTVQVQVGNAPPVDYTLPGF